MRQTLSYLLRKVLVISIWIIAIFGLLLSTNLENKFKKDKNTLYIFTWSDVLSSDFLKEFEKESGIKVKIDYYSSNEELIIKLKKIRN
jgi:spermidine/putrescine transport system substrate-binding protein